MNPASNARANSPRGLVLIMIAALLWGTVGVTTKAIFILADTTALSVGFFRLAIASPVLLMTCWLTLGRRTFRIEPRDLALMLLIGAMLALYQVCFFAAIQHVGVAVAVLVTLCTAPVIIAMLAALLLREPVTVSVVLALAGALTGTVMLIWTDSGAAEIRRDTVIGVLLALGAAFGYALITLCSRRLAGRYHPIQAMTIGIGAGALMLLPFALSSGLVITYSPAGWGLLLHLGIVPTALAYALFLAGMRSTTATVAGIVTLIEPLAGTALAWLLFGERLGPLGLFGAALLLGAIGLLYRDGKQSSRHASIMRVQSDSDIV